MARMRAVDAAAAVLRKEGITTLFGIPALSSGLRPVETLTHCAGWS